MTYKIKLWQVILTTIVVSALGALSTGTSQRSRRKQYNGELKQAPWAPPANAYGPVWTINNFFLLLALRQLLEDERIPHREKLLVQQALIWLLFFSFGYVYFRKQSPILAAVWTLADAALATLSIAHTWTKSKTLAAKYLPLLGWTSYAGTVAIYQALKNPDPVTETSAPID